MDLETEEHNKAVGRRIREERLKLGLTSDEFGKLFTPPASKGTISKWENGRYLPNSARMAIIAEKTGKSVDQLLYGDYEARIRDSILKKFDDATDSAIRMTINEFAKKNEKNPCDSDIWETYDLISYSLNHLNSKNKARKDLGKNLISIDSNFKDYITENNIDLKDSEKLENIDINIQEAMNNFEIYGNNEISQIVDGTLNLINND